MSFELTKQIVGQPNTERGRNQVINESTSDKYKNSLVYCSAKNVIIKSLDVIFFIFLTSSNRIH